MTNMIVALGLPHTPWVPERVQSFQRLLDQLKPDQVGGAHPEFVEVFRERESNRIWPYKLMRWGVATGATHLLQLQDDVIAAPDFWPILRAMIEAVPDKIIGLESNHPLGPEMHRTGRRWYRTRAWLVGVGWVWPTDPHLPHGLPQYLAWCEQNPDRVARQNEDSLVNEWAAEHGFDIWHPVPTIIDHDIGVPSTYGNDDHHEWSMYRRPTVTWRDVPLLAGLQDPNFWRTSPPPLLQGPGTQLCHFCLLRPTPLVSQATGSRICPQCALQTLAAILPK